METKNFGWFVKVIFGLVSTLAAPAFAQNIDLGPVEAEGKLIVKSYTDQYLIQFEKPFDYEGPEFTVHAPIGSYLLARNAKWVASEIEFFGTCVNIHDSPPAADCSDPLGMGHFHGVDVPVKNMRLSYGMKVTYAHRFGSIRVRLPTVGAELEKAESFIFGNCMPGYDNCFYFSPNGPNYYFDTGTVNVQGKTIKIKFLASFELKGSYDGEGDGETEELSPWSVFLAEDTELRVGPLKSKTFGPGKRVCFKKNGYAYASEGPYCKDWK